MATELQKFFNEHKVYFLKSTLEDHQPTKYRTRSRLERLASDTSTTHNGENIGDINRTVNSIVTRSKSKCHATVSEEEEASSIDSDHSSRGNSSHGNSSHDDSEPYSADKLTQQEAESDDLYREEDAFEQEEYEEDKRPKTRKRKRNATRGIGLLQSVIIVTIHCIFSCCPTEKVQKVVQLF